MRKLIFIILIVSFSVYYYYSNSKNKDSYEYKLISNLIEMVKKATPLSQNKSAAQSNVQSDSQSASSDSPIHKNLNESLHEFTLQELIKWVATEANSLNSTTNNTDEKQIKLKAQALTLNSDQLAALNTMATNTDLPINDRILSAYLISLNTSDASQEQLFNVAKKLIPDLGPIIPHSEAELKHSQELAIRYMQVDELFQRAKTDANALHKLKLLSQEAESAQVRSYADKKLKELK